MEEEEAAMPKEDEEQQQEQEEINIGTILRYLVQDAESPVAPDNVVLGPDIITGLGEHINTEGHGPFPSTSGGHQFVSTPALTALGMPNTPAPHLRAPTYANLHRSLHQQVGAAGMRHDLNPNVSWETLIDESRGNPVSREDKARGIVCTVKPTYSFYVDLLNITLSDTDSEVSRHSHHSQHDEDPLQSLMDTLNVNAINWDNIEITQNDLNIFVPDVIVPIFDVNINVPNLNNNIITPGIRSPIPSLPSIPDAKSPLSSRGSSIDTLILDNDDQITIDIEGRQRLIDNPREVWWVSEPPHHSESEDESSQEGQENPDNQDNQDNEDNQDEDSSETKTTHHSSVVREVRPVVVPAPDGK